MIIIDHSNTSDDNNSKTINTKKNTQKNQPNLSNDNTLKTKTPNSNTPSLKNTYQFIKLALTFILPIKT